MYQNFIGIDIGKNKIDVNQYGSDRVNDYSNTPEGFSKWYETYKTVLSNSLVVLETTGGYEKALILFLQSHSIAVHRANTRKVKYFIRSYGQLGKSDTIDAKGLSHYAYERHKALKLYVENEQEALRQLVLRRTRLKQMIVQEKNRLKAPGQEALKESYQRVIQSLEEEKAAIESEIEKLYQSDQSLNEKLKTVKSVTGIGETVGRDLLALLPELGTVDRRCIASLGGLAPHPNESGRWIGYRFVRGGAQRLNPCYLWQQWQLHEAVVD